MLGKKKLGIVLVSLALLSYMTTTLVSSISHKRKADSGYGSDSEEAGSARSPAVPSLRAYGDDGRIDMSNCMRFFHFCTIYSTCIIWRLTNKPICTCPEACAADFEPICGSDGRLYLNHCDLMHKSCVNKRNTTQRYYGTCLPEDYAEIPETEDF